MNVSIDQLIRIIRALWNLGNYWLRIVIWVLLAMPAVLVGAALIGRVLVAILALVLGVVIVLALAHRPLVVGVLSLEANAAALLRTLRNALIAELVFAGYLSVVPVANQYTLIPVTLVMMLLVVTVKRGFVRGAAATILTICTIVFFLGGWDHIVQTASGVGTTGGPKVANKYTLKPGRWTMITFPNVRSSVNYVLPEDVHIKYSEGGKVFTKTANSVLLPSGNFSTTLDESGKPVADQVIQIHKGKRTIWLAPKGTSDVEVEIEINKESSGRRASVPADRTSSSHFELASVRMHREASFVFMNPRLWKNKNPPDGAGGLLGFEAFVAYVQKLPVREPVEPDTPTTLPTTTGTALAKRPTPTATAA